MFEPRQIYSKKIEDDKAHRLVDFFEWKEEEDTENRYWFTVAEHEHGANHNSVASIYLTKEELFELYQNIEDELY